MNERFLYKPSITKYLSTFESYACSYIVEVSDSRDLPAIKLNITKNHVENKLKDILVEIKGFKFQITLQVTFCKEIKNGSTKHVPPIYLNSSIQTVAIDLDINNSLNTSYQTIFSNFQK